MQRVFLRNIAKRQPGHTVPASSRPGFLVHVAVAVLDVAQRSRFWVSQVRTDLVRAAGNPVQCGRAQTAMQRITVTSVMIFVPLAFMGVNAHLVAFTAVLQPGNMPPGPAGHRW